MDFVAIVTTLGIVQGIFFGIVFLFIKRENRRAQVLLGLLFISFAISIDHFLLQHTNSYVRFPHLIRVSFPVLFLFGPLFYYYAILLINRDYSFGWKDTLHLIPFIAMVVMSIPFYLLPAEEKILQLQKIDSGEEKLLPLITGIVQIVQLFIYIIATNIRVRRYRKNLNQIRSQTEQIDLSWLYSGTIAFIVIFGLMLVLMVLWIYFNNMEKVYSVTVPVLVSIVIYYQGYRALMQKDIVFSKDEILSLEGKKYEKSSLTEEKSEFIKSDLLSLLDGEKAYLDPEVSLTSLSRKLSVSPNHLSQVINENIGASFFDLINGRRIEESKKMLKDRPEYTILAVAMECGFNSKSAFNSAFKKFTGVTPSFFQKSALNQGI